MKRFTATEKSTKDLPQIEHRAASRADAVMAGHLHNTVSNESRKGSAWSAAHTGRKPSPLRTVDTKERAPAKISNREQKLSISTRHSRYQGEAKHAGVRIDRSSAIRLALHSRSSTNETEHNVSLHFSAPPIRYHSPAQQPAFQRVIPRRSFRRYHTS
jgi:hypothetical protein